MSIVPNETPSFLEPGTFSRPISESQIRVCHIGKYYPPARGGIETHVQALARAQAQLGADVQVICVNHADEGGDDVSWRWLARTRTSRELDRASTGLSDFGVAPPLHGGGRSNERSLHRGLGTEEHLVSSGVNVLRLGRQANLARLDLCARLPSALWAAVREGVQVVHLHVPNATFLLPLLALRGPQLFVTHHSDIVRQRILRYALRPIEELLYRRAERILTTSPAYMSGSTLLRTHSRKVEVVPLGIDPAAWANPDPVATTRLRSRLGRVSPNAPLWLSVGRLVYYKGLETAVRALSEVPGHWAVVGTGPMQANLEALARATGVRERITFLGELSADELVAAYHLATALWFPSNARSEAFGLVQVEAMAAGCPVINCAIDGSGVPWVCEHGEAGLTVSPNDDAAFSRAAHRLLAEPGLRDRLAAGARARAQAFDQLALARRTLTLYSEAIQRSAGVAERSES